MASDNNQSQQRLAFAAVDDGSSIEIDSTGGSDTSDNAEESSLTTMSLSESVRDFAFENDRRYHKFREGTYQFPNDEPEQAREDMKHAMIINLCNGKLHYAPLHNPKSILDIGTGTGIWAIDMADEYPEAEVVGIDLSPIQPNWLPRNLRFIVDDVEADWLHKPNSIDYIHIRHMTSSIRNWPKLLAQAYSALKPGGWIELQELRFHLSCDDGTLKPGDPVEDWMKTVGRGMAAMGVNVLAMEKNPENLLAAGFANITERRFKLPLGVWPRDPKMKMIGLYNRSIIFDGLHGISIGACTRGLKWAPDEVEAFLVGVRRALFNARVHSYLPFHAVIGQKPPT